VCTDGARLWLNSVAIRSTAARRSPGSAIVSSSSICCSACERSQAFERGLDQLVAAREGA
jgi:hypothetical protein